MTELTVLEQTDLARCEAVIDRNLQAFWQVGDALTEIRDKRLYRSTHNSFEDYCREKWALSKTHANRLIGAADVAHNLTPTGLQMTPTGVTLHNERQLRPLVGLTPDAQREIWTEVTANGKPTAAKVIQAVNVRQSKVNQGLLSSESDDWHTPQHIIDRVVMLFGVIDLDPCSNSKEQPNVPAKVHYTLEDNGIKKHWFKHVYMNPPYGDAIIVWVQRLIKAYTTNEIYEGIALLPARTDTNWFQPLFDYPICFIKGRLKFSNSNNSAPFPSVIVYLGKDYDLFGDCFSDLGRLVKPFGG